MFHVSGAAVSAGMAISEKLDTTRAKFLSSPKQTQKNGESTWSFGVAMGAYSK